jgi:hypothetical protein
MKGIFISCEGNIYRGTKPAALKLLKAVARGEEVDFPEGVGFEPVAPILCDVVALDAETAKALFTKVSLD